MKEIRVFYKGAYRVIYVTKFAEAIYVLHAFQKKTEKTSKTDLDIIKSRYKTLLKQRGNHHE